MTTPPPDLASLRIERDRSDDAAPARGRRRWPIAFVVLAIAAALAYALRPRSVAVATTTATVTGGAEAAGAGITANGYVVARTKASGSAKVPGRLAVLGVQ